MLKSLELLFSKFISNHSKLSENRLLWQDMIHKIDLFLPKLKGLDNSKTQTSVFQFFFLPFHFLVIDERIRPLTHVLSFRCGCATHVQRTISAALGNHLFPDSIVETPPRFTQVAASYLLTQSRLFSVGVHKETRKVLNK